MNPSTAQLLRRIRLWVIVLIVIAIYIWSSSVLNFEGIKEYGAKVSKAILQGFLHPDWSFVYIPEGEDLLRAILETLAISVLSTFVSAVLCIPFAFWASNNMHRMKLLFGWRKSLEGLYRGSGKVFLSVVRTIPEVVMAIMFIKAVGPNPFAGVLALGVHSIGMLGKLFSEAVENMDRGPTEALTACGANRLQILWYAVFPQVLPDFLSYSLYRFEINVRSATILGIIGAGGIGAPLIFALSSRSWSRVGIILYGIILMVTVIDLISGYLRKKIV